MKIKLRKERASLTLLYSSIVFCILLLSVLVAAAFYYLMARLGVISGFGVPRENGAMGLLTMVIISAVVGLVVTFLTRNIPLEPVNRVINNMNRLAAGDFKARMSFSNKLGRHPTFEELSSSFNALAQELENTEMLRSDFINNFSHEFKTPIVSIAGFAKLLRRGNVDEQQREEYLAIIEEESLRLAAMATNVLNLTKIENQTILADVTSFNLSEQLRSCVLMLEESWSRKQLTLDLSFGEYSIQGNKELLREVWLNLLDNAIKYSPRTGEIILNVKEQGETLLVSLTNFDSEIPADKLEKIFQKFYQADESHASQGNGVGLAIVRRVVELHKGRVWAESDQGVTTFYVELPKEAIK